MASWPREGWGFLLVKRLLTVVDMTLLHSWTVPPTSRPSASRTGSVRPGSAGPRAEPSAALPQVPALVLQSGVLRCRVPPHPPGIVRICLTNGDGRPRSRLHLFEYRDAPDATTGALNRWA